MHRNKASFGSEDGVCPSRSNRLFGPKSRAFIIRKPGFPPIYTGFPCRCTEKAKKNANASNFSLLPYFNLNIVYDYAYKDTIINSKSQASGLLFSEIICIVASVREHRQGALPAK